MWIPRFLYKHTQQQQMNTEYIELEDNQTIEKDDEMLGPYAWVNIDPCLVGVTYKKGNLLQVRRKKLTDDALLLSAALSSLEKAEKELDVLTAELSKQRYLNHKHLSVLTFIGSMFGTRAYIDTNNELTEDIDVEILPYLVERVIYSAELLSRKLSNQLTNNKKEEEAYNK